MEKHPLHLKNPELQTQPEVERAVERKSKRNKERISNDPTQRIEAYMDRLENIFLNPNKEKRERNLEMLRHKIYDALIIKRENFPESYFELQQRVMRERGQAVEVIPPRVREQMKDVAIEDQKASLDNWINYLTSDDAVYPAWYKYFVWRNITKLSQFDKERGEFKKRTAGTVAPYPDIYREPLAQIADIYEKVKEDNKNLKDPEIQEQFSKKFPTLYAELIQKSLEAQLESKEEIKGKWIKYEKGRRGNAEKLFKSLEGKGTGWCTAGMSTAKAQVESGDFYVYYTNDAKGNPTQPRVAIRMEDPSTTAMAGQAGLGQRIAEVRGILPHQGLEPQMQEVLDKKLQEFGKEADVYRKKSHDMKKMTAIQLKVESQKPLTKDDLIFLYEINVPIEGFGYEKDPRINELRKQRDPKEDAPIVFECKPEEIAYDKNQINENTKVYVGKLVPGIFTEIKKYKIEHVYTSFPEGRIRMDDVEIGGKTVKELIAELKKQKINISDYALDMLNSKDFTTSETVKHIELVGLKVRDFGFSKNSTTDELYAKAKELELDLCPAETGPTYRLKYKEQPLEEWFYIAMKQIADRDGDPSVFGLGRNEGGLWLSSSWAGPGIQRHPGGGFVFSLR